MAGDLIAAHETDLKGQGRLTIIFPIKSSCATLVSLKMAGSEDGLLKRKFSSLRADQNSMKTGFLNKKFVPCPPRGRDGMTLVEVVIALAITGIIVAGIVSGYIYCSTATVKDSLYMAANARAMERLEETRTAQWDPAGGGDQLVTTNFPDETNVILDMSPSSPAVTTATIKTTISDLSLSPPIRTIHVDCIWLFRGVEPVTNSIETCRAPD